MIISSGQVTENPCFSGAVADAAHYLKAILVILKCPLVVSEEPVVSSQVAGRLGVSTLITKFKSENFLLLMKSNRLIIIAKSTVGKTYIPECEIGRAHV